MSSCYLALENGVLQLVVCDLMGRNLITQTITTAQTTIATKTLSAGVYFYTITQNGKTITTDKLMIKE